MKQKKSLYLVYNLDLNLIITVPADGLAPNDTEARMLLVNRVNRTAADALAVCIAKSPMVMVTWTHWPLGDMAEVFN